MEETALSLIYRLTPTYLLNPDISALLAHNCIENIKLILLFSSYNLFTQLFGLWSTNGLLNLHLCALTCWNYAVEKYKSSRQGYE